MVGHSGSGELLLTITRADAGLNLEILVDLYWFVQSVILLNNSMSGICSNIVEET